MSCLEDFVDMSKRTQITDLQQQFKKGPDLILIYFWLFYLNNHFFQLYLKKSCYLTVVSITF